MHFKPPWWLSNPHAQTIWSTLTQRKVRLTEQWERVELPDGDFLDLTWDASNWNQLDKPLVLILPGLEGSIHSTYAKGLMQALSNQEFRPVFMHHRGCSGVPNRFARSYHSGKTDDIAFIAEKLKNANPSTTLQAIGISLGGNALLKWLGETGGNNPLDSAIAISVPFNLPIVANRLMTGFSRIYQAWLLRKLKRNIKLKIDKSTYPLKFKEIKTIRTFWQFDNLVTAPLHGFNDVHDYYKKASCRQYLGEIAKPTLIIHAKDDPFMTPEIIPSENELSKSTRLLLSDCGGHVGFIKGLRSKSWLEENLPEFLHSHL